MNVKQFIEKNLFLVIAAIVTLAALAFMALPMYEIGQAHDAGEQMAKSHDDATQTARIAETPRWIVESQENIDKIVTAQGQVVESALRYANRPPMLVPDNAGVPELIFPAPALVDESRINFKKSYQQGLKAFLATLGAGWLPTDEEFAAAEKTAADTYAGIANEAELNRQKEIAKAEVLDKKAGSIHIWANPQSLDDYMDFLQRSHDEPVALRDTQLWAAMLNWWVQKDIIEAIAQVNKAKIGAESPKDVVHCPIKELVYIHVEPDYLRKADSKESTLTGRFSGDRYDVLLYKFQVVMDTSRFAMLAGALSARNFHTVLSASYAPLDKRGEGREKSLIGGGAAAGAAGATAANLPTLDKLRYGANPLMVVTLVGEAVFMKSPASWEQHPEKRLEFLRRPENRTFILAVIRQAPGGSPEFVLRYSTLAAAAPAARDQLLNPLFKQAETDRNLRFIASYEDLMPRSVVGQKLVSGTAAHP